MTVKMKHDATPDMIEGARANLILAIETREAFERSLITEANDNASMMKFLSRYKREASKLDAFSLAYAAATNFDFVAHFNSTRYEGARFNIYAAPKLHFLMRVLNGANWQSLTDSDSATLAGTLAALESGHTEGKRIANALDDFMNSIAGRRDYKSGGTQSGSSLRALEALGIVRKASARAWEIADKTAFKTLARAASKATRE
jgi:hypothetical protein